MAGSVRGNVVLDWNAVMMAAIRLDNTGPTLSTRNLAMLHLAIFDAVNSVERTHQPYAFEVETSAGTSVEAAAAAAGYSVVKALYPGIGARADETFELWRAGAPDDDSTREGIALGNDVARLMLAHRAGDGAATEVPYIPSPDPGQWRRTPPFFRPPLTPGWRYVKPFAIAEVEPFVSPPPPALDSPAYAMDLNEVVRLGAKASLERTEEQGLIARFWSDFSYTAMPPGHWHEIAATIAAGAANNLVESARLMALLSLAQADGAIVCWETKFRYNLWRPVTAIQRADEDGNAATDQDAAWDHYLAAPPFPAYPSGHSTFSQASAEVLTFFYGTDAISFTAVSDSVPGVVRGYDSLSACAAEIGMSRVYGGIHFGFDNREGKRMGKRIAQDVVAHWLLPVANLPMVRPDGLVGGKARVRVHGRLGTRVVLEWSSDLKQWFPLTVVESVSGGRRVEVERDGELCVFFRVREE
jgi:membrane-associated phospholipid phosphatase